MWGTTGSASWRRGVDEDVLDEDFLLYTARPVNALATSTKM
jgi:hypothetical protein